MADITGTDGNDTLIGTDGDDRIDGLAGNDQIDGGDGDDVINAGDGNDQVRGGTGRDTIIGGGDNDLLDGGDDDDLIIIDGFPPNGVTNTTVRGGSGGSDFDRLDISALLDQGFEIQNLVQNPDSDGNGFNYQIQLRNPATNRFANINAENIEALITTPICFTPGTTIATARGLRPVERLRPGERIVTRDNGLQPLAWVGCRKLTAVELTARPKLQPVLIRQGALGHGLPERDMMISPNHRMLMRGRALPLYSDASEGLAAAKHLLGRPGVAQVRPTEGVTYCHLMFENHQIVLGDGAWSESFQPGAYSLGALDRGQRTEILDIFPDLATEEGLTRYVAARRGLDRRDVAVLA